MLKLAVIGDPVSHSRSPELFREFLREAGLAGSYDAIRIAAGDGARRIDELRREGYDGLNVTTPLKEEAFARAESHDAIALAAGSVNLLVLGETIAGYNTDGAGALGALAAAGLADPHGAQVLILGAGPTARASAAALAERGAEVTLWNRTPVKAEAAARATGATLWREARSFDAVLSALLPEAEVPPEVARALAESPRVIDANYGPRAQLARALGRSDVHDGIEMLRASARASFEIFTR